MSRRPVAEPMSTTALEVRDHLWGGAFTVRRNPFDALRSLSDIGDEETAPAYARCRGGTASR